MYLDEFVAFRCPREIYRRLKKAIRGNHEIENPSHACRIAVLKYIKELENEQYNKDIKIKTRSHVSD